jgi:hypothetical protein
MTKTFVSMMQFHLPILRRGPENNAPRALPAVDNA